MIKNLISVAVLCATISIHAGEILVTNNTGEQNLWGATYYVFSGSAQRVSSPQQITSRTIIALPEEKQNAARYLITARSASLLEPMIMAPFGVVGIRLTRVGEGSMHSSMTIERDQLPTEKV